MYIIDGGGSPIATGPRPAVEIPHGFTIAEVRLLADQTGSITVDIWKDSYANYPPTNADSITASATPSISSGNKYSDTTLSGWTKTISDEDILKYNVDSCTTITWCAVILKAE